MNLLARLHRRLLRTTGATKLTDTLFASSTSLAHSGKDKSQLFLRLQAHRPQNPNDSAKASERQHEPPCCNVMVWFWGQQARRSQRPVEATECGPQSDEWYSNGCGLGHALWEPRGPRERSWDVTRRVWLTARFTQKGAKQKRRSEVLWPSHLMKWLQLLKFGADEKKHPPKF